MKANIFFDTENNRYKVYMGETVINTETLTINEIAIDSELSDTSENAVQNKVIKGALDTHTNDINLLTSQLNNLIPAPMESVEDVSWTWTTNIGGQFVGESENITLPANTLVAVYIPKDIGYFNVICSDPTKFVDTGLGDSTNDDAQVVFFNTGNIDETTDTFHFGTIVSYEEYKSIIENNFKLVILGYTPELKDVRVAYDGTVYPTAGDAVRSIMANLQYNTKHNILNESNAVIGYYNLTSGKVRLVTQTSGGSRAVAVPVKSNEVYTSTKLNRGFCYFTESPETPVNGTSLTYMEGVNLIDSNFLNLAGFTPPTDGYLLLSYSSSESGKIMVVNDNKLPSNYKAYNVNYIQKLGGVELDTREHNARVIRVEKDGSGDFTTLKSAIEYTNTHEDITVLVGSGTYDLIEEFGADYFANLGNVQNSGLLLNNRVHVIFSSNSKVVCNYTGDNNNVMVQFSPFNADKNNGKGFTLENLNLECSRVRYGVHDECNQLSTPYRNIYKNCRIVIDNSNNTASITKSCIGGGLGQAGEILIENCYFESANSTADNIVSYHNTGSSTGRSNIVVKDCYFAGSATFKASYMGQSTDITTVQVTGCNCAIEPYVIPEISTAPVVNVVMKAWNNTIRN